MDAAQGFDLDAVDAPFNLVLVPAKGDAPATGLYVASVNAPAVQQAEIALTAQTLRRSALRGSPIDLTTEDGAELAAESSMERRTALAVSAVTGWYGFVKAGVPVDFDVELLKVLFAKRPAWRDAVLEAMDTEANFTQG